MKLRIDEKIVDIEIPKGFNTADTIDEKNDADSWTAQDEERHMIINMGWKKVPFFERNTPLEKTLKNTVKKFRSKVLCFTERRQINTMISGEHACGYRYSYMADGIEHMSEFVLVKYNIHYLAFVFICYEKDFYDYYEVFEGFLKTVHLN